MLAISTLATVRIGGPRYQHIASGSGLLSDIQPPPVYLVELDLLAHRLLSLAEAARGPEVQRVLDEATDLKKAYETRLAFWQADANIPPAVQTVLASSVEPAHRLLALFDESLVPAVRAGRFDDARELLNGDLADAFAAHRSTIGTLTTGPVRASARGVDDARRREPARIPAYRQVPAPNRCASTSSSPSPSRGCQ